MKGILKELTAKLYSFYYFMFWGFYFSAGYFFYKNTCNSFLVRPCFNDFEHK
ncbi:hypothetical protein C4097_14000 [Clostridioides difficile]|nr:hypothetical protein KW94_10220 [Clostridioides difficile]MDB3085635.1 hypothetical protein [Clostridioides difficile]